MADSELSEVLTSGMPAVVFIVSENGKILDCNHLFEATSGYMTDEVVTMSALDFFPQGEKQFITEKIQQTFAAGAANVEANLLAKDGRLIPFHFINWKKTIDGKAVLVCLGISVTDRKGLEELAYFQAYLLDSVADAVACCDDKYDIVAWNRAAEKMYGIKEKEAMGKNVMQVTKSSISDAQLKELLRSLAESGNGYLQTVHHRQDGSPLNVEIRFRRLTGESARYVSVIRDITERVRVEQEKELLIGKLQQALGEVKTLSGLLPICAACKKIRDDQGYWHQVEIFVKKHTEADFTHGLCPECAEKTRDEYLKSKGPAEQDDEP